MSRLFVYCRVTRRNCINNKYNNVCFLHNEYNESFVKTIMTKNYREAPGRYACHMFSRVPMEHHI